MHGNFEHLLLDDDGQSNFLSINISIRRFNHITSNPFMSVHVISYTIMSVQNLVFHLAGTSVGSFKDLFGIHTSNNQYRFNKVNTIFVCLFVCVFFNLVTDGNPDFVGVFPKECIFWSLAIWEIQGISMIRNAMCVERGRVFVNVNRVFF